MGRWPTFLLLSTRKSRHRKRAVSLRGFWPVSPEHLAALITTKHNQSTSERLRGGVMRGFGPGLTTCEKEGERKTGCCARNCVAAKNVFLWDPCDYIIMREIHVQPTVNWKLPHITNGYVWFIIISERSMFAICSEESIHHFNHSLWNVLKIFFTVWKGACSVFFFVFFHGDKIKALGKRKG